MNSARGFSTSPQGLIKRGHDIIRDRCISTIEALKQDGFTSEVPLDHAIEVFETVTGKHDRLTRKAYFGRLESTTRRTFDITKRYSSGSVCTSNVTISERISVKHGYLEKLGFSHLEKRRNPSGLERLFLILHENPLVPEIEVPP